MVMRLSAQDVAKALASVYYPILAKQPHLVHKFYKDTSTLVRVEDDGSTSTTTTTKAINEKILSLNTGNKFDITSIDAQESTNMDVHIIVTGFETGRDNVVRDFVQFFWLEPIENIDNGYYLLHDMFRYAGKANQLDDSQIPVQEVSVPGQTEDRSTDLGIEGWVLCSGSPHNVITRVGMDVVDSLSLPLFSLSKLTSLTMPF
ncbi:hypothetical protein POM88_019619 [Heracleum sosnowskyi]|uniref:NTF2 domain-containing protein n=1 Tax=Heracleum sosnowskyi TaxID=360622 RepID=A0AAD8IB80_9APIA|nr:hypothetical protein POM88_019619 [Heracleum sosnowskyi]